MSQIYLYSGTKAILFVAVLLSATPRLAAQQPSNDDCIQAEEVSCGDTAYYLTYGNLYAATPSATQVPQCTGREPEGAQDVWYKFTASNARQEIMAGPCLTCFTVDLDFAVYSGDCSDLHLISCAASPYQYLTESKIFDSLEVGRTYYVRVYEYNQQENRNTFDFSFGVRIPTVEQEPSALFTLQPDRRRGLTLYPVPCNSSLTVAAPATIPLEGMLYLYDINGRIMEQIKLHEDKVIIATGNWPAGWYAYRYVSNREMLAGVFVKQ